MQSKEQSNWPTSQQSYRHAAFCTVLQVSNKALKKTCPVPFDEGRLWKGANAAELKQDLQKHFQNITRVMDCVGCEKCKLWGKLQVLGELCRSALLCHISANLEVVSSMLKQCMPVLQALPLL